MQRLPASIAALRIGHRRASSGSCPNLAPPPPEVSPRPGHDLRHLLRREAPPCAMAPRELPARRELRPEARPDRVRGAPGPTRHLDEPKELWLRSEPGLLPKLLPENLNLLRGEHPQLSLPLAEHGFEELPLSRRRVVALMPSSLVTTAKVRSPASRSRLASMVIAMGWCARRYRGMPSQWCWRRTRMGLP